ncbi:MAG: Rrf2 family transcriptional regulator [Deltaproteobacteria bacterium]|nr:Rrf2 family transcriptional regulator [Deltaproteobacteria bacterium]
MSTRGRYATRALLDLALNPDEGPTSLKEVAARLEVSPKYLDQILSQLRNAGIVRATRGSKGGFSLAADPKELRILDVITVMEGKTSIVDCVVEKNVCPLSEECVTRDVWTDVSAAIDKVLGAITLNDLVKKVSIRKKKNVACPK